GAQPAVAEAVRGLDPVVGTGDPRAPHLEFADGLAVVGQHGAVLVGQAGLDRGGEAALGVAVAPGLLAGGAGRRVRHRAQGEVSVMPQACSTDTPCLSSKACMTLGGTAE